MPDITSLPSDDENPSDKQGSSKEHGFGYFETCNYPKRKTQEDALAWHTLTKQDLTPTGASAPLSPIEIGHRLWTSYRLLDKADLKPGTTASTTVYDGRGNLITATLADAVSFAVIYDKNGVPLGVIRLNKVTDKPTNFSEGRRIEEAGGTVRMGRVNWVLAVSRAIGDSPFKGSGVCSEAHIDITNVSKIAKELNINPDNIGSIQVITTCDGFTDGAGTYTQSKEAHEQYLLNALSDDRFKAMSDNKAPGKMPEDELAKLLAQRAKEDGSVDNISVAIQTLPPSALISLVPELPLLDIILAIFMGVYDGHGGTEASVHVATNIGRIFKEQCALTPEAYAQQEFSVNKNAAAYNRDNVPAIQGSSLDLNSANTIPMGTDRDGPLSKPKIGPVSSFGLNPPPLSLESPVQKQECEAIVKQLLELTEKYQRNLEVGRREYWKVLRIIKHLVTLLHNDAKKPQDKIKEFYTYLYKTEELPSNFNTFSKYQNINILEDCQRVSAIEYLKGIAIIAAIILTGIIPGLCLIGIVLSTTGKPPFDLFPTVGKQLVEGIDLIKEKNKPYAAFFQPEPQSKVAESEAVTPKVDTFTVF